MPDEQQNNDQLPVQPDEQLPPVEPQRPLDEQVPESNDAAPQASHESSYPQEPSTVASEPSATAPESPSVDQPPEQSTPPESTPINNSELPPAQQPYPSFSAEPSGFDSTAPTVAPQPVVSEQNKPKRKKGLIAAIIAIVVAVLLIGGAAAGYFLWYQNPDKVVMDSLVKALNADSSAYAGTVEINNESIDIKVDIDGHFNQDGTANTMTATLTPKNTGVDMGEMTVSGEAIVMTDTTMYIKMTDLQDAYAELRDSLVQNLTESYAESGFTFTSEQIAAMKDEVDKMYKPIVEKMSDQWIKIAPSDTEDVDDSDNELSCISNAFKKAAENGSFTDDIASAYRENTFIVVAEELGTKDGSVGYLLDYDEATAKAFGEATEETQLAKDVIACTCDDTASATDDESPLKDQRFELWVDQWSHEPTRIVAQGTTTDEDATTFSIDMTTELNATVEVTAPADAKPLEEVLDLEDDPLLGAMFAT